MWKIKKRKHKKPHKKEGFRLYALTIVVGVLLLTMVRKQFIRPLDVAHTMQRPMDMLQGVQRNLMNKALSYITSPDNTTRPPVPLFRPKCRDNEFKLQNMTSCHKKLYCDAIYHEVQKGSYFGKGKTKKVQHGTWEGHQVTLSHWISKKGKNSKSDFYEHLSNLIRLQSPFVTQLVGFCNVSKSAEDYAKSFIVTEHEERGSLEVYLNSKEHINTDGIGRLGVAVSYLKTLNFLHNQTEGSLIICDSNDLKSSLQNFLVTSDRRVILNDLDDLPLVNQFGRLAQCKHQDQLSEQPSVVGENFLAPEQRTALFASFPTSPIARLERNKDIVTSTGIEIDAEGRPPPSLSAKVDVYKIPNIVEAILLINREKLSKLSSDSYRKSALQIWSKLSKINQECKDQSPKARPTVAKVLAVYENVLTSLLNA